jgi:hypothetical protein
LVITPGDYPEHHLQSVRAVSSLESSFLEMAGNLHRTLGWEYSKLGWSGVKKKKLVSWGICDSMNKHLINLQLHNNAEDSEVRRYLKEQSSSYFVNCVAQFARACIDIWVGLKETNRVSVEIERFFSLSGHLGKRPDILVLPVPHPVPWTHLCSSCSRLHFAEVVGLPRLARA